MQKRTVSRKFRREQSAPKTNEQTYTMTEMFERFMLIKKSEGLARRTIKEYYINFDYFMRYTGKDLSQEEMTMELFCGWISHMAEEMELAPATINIRVRTMRSFIRFCYEEKGWVTEPIHRRFKPVKAPIDNVESLTTDEIRKLIGAIDNESYTGFRTKVIVFVLLDTMVRVCELVDIKRENIDLKKGFIQLEAADTKTRVARVVPLSLKTIKLLEDYLQETAEFGNEYAFLTYEGVRISEATVRDNLALYGKIAQIKNKRVSPHTFRHTAALFYILNGGDPFSLQRILGHSHMNMVRRYIQMTSTDVQIQHNSYSPINYLYK
ncbi:integrase/recombinase XerD [Cytobacillus oceanisediminis]|uniref:Integrase/recombinase XerD n=1 Tax=Cytobacillus oceanisediminis TaxID=665099 RepID=A0A2V2ZJT7_9BACI|nr:site-specific integrase [Cytobacillus oceanisediminis]PWW20199.1 integrase/recombinase XerD [Cytobacillus oceanisediminis]